MNSSLSTSVLKVGSQRTGSRGASRRKSSRDLIHLHCKPNINTADEDCCLAQDFFAQFRARPVASAVKKNLYSCWVKHMSLPKLCSPDSQDLKLLTLFYLLEQESIPCNAKLRRQKALQRSFCCAVWDSRYSPELVFIVISLSTVTPDKIMPTRKCRGGCDSVHGERRKSARLGAPRRQRPAVEGTPPFSQSAQ